MSAAALLAPATSAQGSTVERDICAAPHDGAVKLGIDGYIDPQTNCVT